MAKMGNGYGSEYHLLRFLGRHRTDFDDRVASAVGAQSVQWLDYRFNSKNIKDPEWKGLDFLPETSQVRKEWKKSWPQTGNPPNWDAVGKVCINGAWEWLLVEAKAHVRELKSCCEAKEEGGRQKIEQVFEDTIKDIDISAEVDKWMIGYYQHANRIAVLNFMLQHGESARMLFVYFCGDDVPGQCCPKNEEEWLKPLAEQDQHLGLSGVHKWADRVHKLFVPVVGTQAAAKQ